MSSVLDLTGMPWFVRLKGGHVCRVKIFGGGSFSITPTVRDFWIAENVKPKNTNKHCMSLSARFECEIVLETDSHRACDCVRKLFNAWVLPNVSFCVTVMCVMVCVFGPQAFLSEWILTQLYSIQVVCVQLCVWSFVHVCTRDWFSLSGLWFWTFWPTADMIRITDQRRFDLIGCCDDSLPRCERVLFENTNTPLVKFVHDQNII